MKRLSAWILGSLLMTAVAGHGVRAEEDGKSVHIEVAFMSVPKGGDQAYLDVERLWRKFQIARREAGVVKDWMVFRVERVHGPSTDYQYAVLNFYDSWAQLNAPRTGEIWSRFFDKLTAAEQQQVMQTDKVRDMLRVNLWSLEATALPWQWSEDQVKTGFTGNVGFMKSKAFGHLDLEKTVYQKLWAKAAAEGYVRDWHCWRQRYPSGKQAPYDLIAAVIQPEKKDRKPFPEGWWKEAVTELFPERAEKLMAETTAARDIPIRERWVPLMSTWLPSFASQSE